MILAIDIGNSFTNAGVFRKNTLLFKSMFPTSEDLDGDKIYRQLKGKTHGLQIAGISSVVPEMKHYWKVFFDNYFDIKPTYISAKLKIPIKLKVKKPQNLGSDRLCNAVAGYEMFQHRQNVIVIDFGTATTYDVVLKNGDYLGGIITPGIETSAQSLYLKTSKLPLLTFKKLKFPKKPIGRNTKDAMNSGIMYSALDSMENMVRRIEKFLKLKFKIIITGGLSGLIYKKTSLEVIRKYDLVLTGINYILRYNYEH